MHATLFSAADNYYPGRLSDMVNLHAACLRGASPGSGPGCHKLPPEDEKLIRLKRVERYAQIMDSAVRIPGIGVRVGLDAALGLVPVVGDAASLIISAFLVREAALAGVSRTTVARMVSNVVIDTVVGSIPLLGDLFDVTFRANRRNAALLKKALAKQPSTSKAVKQWKPARVSNAT